MRKIEKLQAETDNKQTNLEQLRREMVELENTLEQEQEALVNKLWKRMDKLETEKRLLQIKLDEPVSDPTTPRDITNANGDTASNLSAHIQTLRSEVVRLRSNLAAAQKEATIKLQQFAQEEKSIREENARLQRKLKLEVERREALCRHLSESESSLEMDEERFYNENLLGTVGTAGGLGNAVAGAVNTRQRTISSPVSHSPSNSRPLSPGSVHQNRCYACGQIVVSISFIKLLLQRILFQRKLIFFFNFSRIAVPVNVSLNQHYPHPCWVSTLQLLMCSVAVRFWAQLLVVAAVAVAVQIPV